jgi:protein-S-isoprenylcysteine O-methyltransferase Ste14
MAKLIVRNTLWIAAMGALLFVPAGTLAWPGAWAFLAEMWVLALGLVGWLLRHDPALLKERTGSFIQRGQATIDKILVVALMVTYCAWFALMGLDRRYGWSSSVPVWLQVIGAVGVLLSVYLSYLTFRENSFASPVVKIQTERAHHVITTGPYRYVRHPMYAGALVHFIGVPLLLGSWWGLAAVPLFMGLFVVRIGIEERTLRAALQGYDAYSARVRYRLIPLIW